MHAKVLNFHVLLVKKIAVLYVLLSMLDSELPGGVPTEVDDIPAPAFYFF